jgi:hypothetical protein
MKSNGIGSATTKSAQDIARSIAKQVAQEPLEILKDAGSQVTGVESSPSQNTNPVGAPENPQAKVAAGQSELKDKTFANHRMQALQTEIEDIRKQGVFKDVQRKISEGVDVPIENYSELSMEQKQVLMAQKEAFKNQQQQANYQSSVSGVPSINSKPSRRFGAGQKHEAEKAQTRVEKPVPPSG